MKVLFRERTLDVVQSPIRPLLGNPRPEATHAIQGRKYASGFDLRGQPVDLSGETCCRHALEVFRRREGGEAVIAWVSRPCRHGVVMTHGAWSARLIVQALGTLEQADRHAVKTFGVQPKVSHRALRVGNS